MRRNLSKKKTIVHATIGERLSHMESSVSEVEKTVEAKLKYMQAYHVRKCKELGKKIKSLNEHMDARVDEIVSEVRKAVYQVQIVSHAYRYLAGQLDRIIEKGVDAKNYEMVKRSILETKEDLEKAHREISKTMGHT